MSGQLTAEDLPVMDVGKATSSIPSSPTASEVSVSSGTRTCTSLNPDKTWGRDNDGSVSDRGEVR